MSRLTSHLVAAFTVLFYSSTASEQTITSWKVRTASPSGFESTKSLPVGTQLKMHVISGSDADVVVLARAAGNPFLIQVGGGNASVQPARVKRSAGL
jgi:hypothetical protein